MSYLVLIASLAAVARRWTPVVAKLTGPIGFGWFLVVLIATPLYAELGFYFNDNVVSAAFGTVLLWLASRRPAAVVKIRIDGFAGSWLCGLTSGAAMGCAILCRPDAAFLLPLAAGLGWLNLNPVRRLLVFSACFAAAFIGALLPY